MRVTEKGFIALFDGKIRKFEMRREFINLIEKYYNF
jgi:hypothetical protein